jgi:hypothetical protein
MKSLFKNNIFTNPVGWAEGPVGTKLRYRITKVFTFAYGMLLFIITFLLSFRPK